MLMRRWAARRRHRGEGRRGKPEMTICIAALCTHADEPRLVFGSDRMVSWGGIVEFEHAVPKVSAASSHAVTMVAGDALVGTKLARDVAGTLGASSPAIENIAAALVQQYDATRRTEIERLLLRPRGLDFGTYYGNQAALNGNVIAVLDQAMANFNLGVELLIAGIDGSGGHIYSVSNPGTSRLHDVIGYAAIGSGNLHALQSLIGFQHFAAAPLPETVFRVYASKRRAEVAPGVGVDTDMGLIAPGGIRWLSEEEKQGLRDIYDEHEASTSSSLQERLSHFEFEQATTTETIMPGGDDDTEPAGDNDREPTDETAASA